MSADELKTTYSKTGGDDELSYAVAEISDSSTDEELLHYSIPTDELKKLLKNLDFHIAPVLMIL